MATVLEVHTTEEQRFLVRFWGPKTSLQRLFIRKFPVYAGKCLSLKVVHNWVEKFSQGRSEVADDARLGAEVTDTSVKVFLCCGFRRTGKAMRQVCQCLWRICRKINVFFSGSNIKCFTFHIHLCPIYWLSLVLTQSEITHLLLYTYPSHIENCSTIS
jgi:hypothetical protein